MTKISGKIHTGTKSVIAERLDRKQVGQSMIVHEEPLSVVADVGMAVEARARRWEDRPSRRAA